jgi:hypothetical protein
LVWFFPRIGFPLSGSGGWDGVGDLIMVPVDVLPFGIAVPELILLGFL